MELRQLRYLVDVVDEGSFTKAARNAYVAQPGVSAQIRGLERELGHTLVDRSGRSVTPTPVGAGILPHARAAIRAVERIGETVAAMTGLVAGRLTIGTVPAIATDRIDLPGLLAGFHRDHPGVEISLSEADSDRLVASLRDGTLEVALISEGATPPERLRIRTLASEPIAVGVVAGHDLARRNRIRLRDLADHPLVTLPRGTGVRSRLDTAAAAADVGLRIAFEAGDPRLVVRLAGAGLGAAVLPRSQLDAAPHPSESSTVDGLRIIPLTEPPLHGRIALAWRDDRGTSPAVRAFLVHAGVTGEPGDDESSS